MSVALASAAAVVLACTGPAAARAASVSGLPAGAARAALRSEPQLPAPSGWSFPDAFSRTSGTGRMIAGAFEWTDWVYDAYGAASPQGESFNSITSNADSLAPARGDYVYPAGAAANDGADIFRAAVGLTPTATVWRIDWNTLADPSLPIAEWTFDVDDNAHTGAAAWPAGANVSSAGIERALVVSAKGSRLIDVASGRTIAALPTRVDRAARSFVVAVPLSVLPAEGAWRVRLAAGLADSAGSGFAVPSLSSGGTASPTAPRVYNVTFRSAAQEPPAYAGGGTDGQVAKLASTLGKLPVLGSYGAGRASTSLVAGNFWGENDQADTLASGDVSKFSATIDWSALAAHRQTSPPLVKGWSDRWYVTDLDLGQGVANGSNANPAFLGRVQPYAVYVPQRYNGRRPLPFTWMLHSASTNYNQYGAVNPRLVGQECESRGSICASSEGFGGDGLYQGAAEHDFWQVWRQMALGYRLDPSRTVVSGYSMGGLASFVLPATYPSVFSEAMPLDGGFDEGCSSAPTGAAQEDIAAAADRSRNLRSLPLVISDSYTDELSPYPSEIAEMQRLEAAGDRFTLFSTTAPEHITTDALDGFSTQVAALHGTPVAATAPGRIDYTWCPQTVDAKLGLGPTGVFWLSGLAQRAAATSSTIARVVAEDRAIADPAETEQIGASVVVPADAPPMQVTAGSWKPAARPARAPVLSLALTDVAALALDTVSAKVARGSAVVDTDGATKLTLTRLRRGTVIHAPHAAIVVGPSGKATVALSAGRSTIRW